MPSGNDGTGNAEGEKLGCGSGVNGRVSKLYALYCYDNFTLRCAWLCAPFLNAIAQIRLLK